MDIHVEHNHSRMSEKLLNTFYKVEEKHWWWKGRREIVKTFLPSSPKKSNVVILDAGCGTGSNIIFLNQFGKTFGVDVSRIATKFCKKRGLKDVQTSDVSSLPFKDNFFDIVSCMDVLEHIEDEKKAVNEIYRVLKPGGEILLTVPALPFIFSEHDKAQGHFRRYSIKQIQRLMKSAGFKEKRTTYFNSFLSLPIIAIRLLSKLKPFSKAADFDSKFNYDIYKVNFFNAILAFVFSQEAIILRYRNLPFGVSILASYQKPLKKRKKFSI